MKLQDISLFESYSTAKQVFGREASPEEVGKRLDQFKALNQRNMLKPEERDLGKWIRAGWEQFSSFVADASSRTSGKSEKKAQRKDSVRVAENEKWLVVIPLSKEASCFYGKGTQWCTAATQSANYFDSYFHDRNITLLYFINKSGNGEKLAAAYHEKEFQWECFDAQDNAISVGTISHITQFSEDTMREWVQAQSGIIGDKRNSKFNPENAAKQIEGYVAEFGKAEKSLYAMIAKSGEWDTLSNLYRKKVIRELYGFYNLAESNMLHLKYAATQAKDAGKNGYAVMLRKYVAANYEDGLSGRFEKLRDAYLEAGEKIALIDQRIT